VAAWPGSITARVFLNVVSAIAPVRAIGRHMALELSVAK
jgi:hypothetical protein